MRRLLRAGRVSSTTLNILAALTRMSILLSLAFSIHCARVWVYAWLGVVRGWGWTRPGNGPRLAVVTNQAASGWESLKGSVALFGETHW
jgi:hypothetical protein